MFYNIRASKPLFLFVLLLCQGCMGATFLQEEDKLQGEFTPLQSVPDRPQAPNMENYREIRKELQASLQNSSK